LRFDLAGSGLPGDVQVRAAALAGHRLTTDGVIVIRAHEHRTQKQNREAARERLIELLSQAAAAPAATQGDEAVESRQGKTAGLEAPSQRRKTAAGGAGRCGLTGGLKPTGYEDPTNKIGVRVAAPELRSVP
jgi:protein subunit release factor B